MSDLIAYSPAVAAARRDGVPIVALESTIITHGLPYPDNLETARSVETVIREAGAEPATIAIMGGHIRIGLAGTDLESLAQAERPQKVSRADFAATLASGRTGSTTVAATMIAARLAGVSVFATGGIGGVHRGAAETFDISADLDELARTPIVVVSAGAKAILDLNKTLEVLETKGVPVVGYQTDTFPAFWSRTSGLPVPLRADTPAEIAAIHEMQARLDMPSGLLVANPVPADDEISQEDMRGYIERAQADADAANIQGKDVTPFILARIAELTNGRSVPTNIALVRNNAALAARLARAIAERAPVP
ncbi:MAG: pseudouridine-5'-phosphate glycosidase [Pseudomonadota bacterium]